MGCNHLLQLQPGILESLSEKKEHMITSKEINIWLKLLSFYRR